MTQRHD